MSQDNHPAFPPESDCFGTVFPKQKIVDNLVKDLEYSHELLRDCLRALNRLDAYEGLCDQIRRVVYGEDGEE